MTFTALSGSLKDLARNNFPVKKIISYAVIVMALLFAVVAISGSRDIVDFKNVMISAILSLIVIFASSAVKLFIFSAFMKDAGRMKTELQLTKNIKNVIDSYTCL
jgi:hypothetical protein